MAQVLTKKDLCSDDERTFGKPVPQIGMFYTHRSYPTDVRYCAMIDNRVVMLDAKTGRRVADVASCKVEVANGGYKIAPHIVILIGSKGD